MESLPKDVLNIIFAYMPTDILGLCSSVCKLWNATCWKSHTILQVTESLKTTGETFALFESLVHKCPNLQSWEFHRCSFVNVSMLLKLSPACFTKLTSLHFVDCPNVSTPICKVISDNCKNLQELHIKDCKRVLNHKNINDIILPPSLLVLNMEGNNHASDDIIAKIVQMCKSLRVLRLKGCYRLGDRSVRSILEGLPDLEVLKIEGLKQISSASFNVLEESKKISKLKELDMRMCDNIDNKVIEIIAAHCPQISILILKFCKKLSDPCASYFSQIPIEHLDLQGTEIGDSALEIISESCPALTTLDLRDCGKLNSSGYCTISSASNLKFLRLRSVNVDDVAATTIARKCAKLKLLDLEGCVSISSDGISFLLSCKNLSRLSLKHVRPEEITKQKKIEIYEA